MIWLKTLQNCRHLCSALKFSPKPMRFIAPVTRKFCETQPKLVKDVILFHYENPRFFKYLNIFAMVQFLFWSFMGHVAASSMRNAPVNDIAEESLPWWKKVNLGERKYKYTMAVLCLSFGFGILSCSWIFTLRSVRYLILNKGGGKVSFVTYAPLGENRILTVPLDKVSCMQSRNSAQSSLPLRVSGHRFYYLLDMRGEFRNGPLFDRTAGVQRRL